MPKAETTGQRIEFFYENAGYGYDPKTETPEQGRLRGAGLLTRAEEWKEAELEAGRLRVEWKDDPRPYELGDAETYKPRRVLGCVVETKCPCCGTWLHAESLWSIGDPSRKYKRVVEAELCLEAMNRKAEGVENA